MKLKLTQNLSGLVLSSVAIAGFACDNPPLVQIPAAADIGDDAARIRAETEDYFNAVTEYVECLKAELAAAGGDAAPATYKAAMVMRNNAAVAEVEAIMKIFEDRFGRATESRVGR